MLPRGGELPGIGYEGLVCLLGAGKAGMVVARRHVGRPEQVFFGLVHLQVIAIQLDEEPSSVLEGFIDSGTSRGSL